MSATVLAQAPNSSTTMASATYRAGTSSMSADGLTLTFVPDAPLAVNRQHACSCRPGSTCQGTSRTHTASCSRPIFATDTAPPAVDGRQPVDGSTGVPRNARVEIRFNESIRAQSLGNVRLLTNGGSAVAVTRTLSDNEPSPHAPAERPAGLESELHHLGERRT